MLHNNIEPTKDIKTLKRIDSKFSNEFVNPGHSEPHLGVELLHAERDVKQLLTKNQFKQEFPQLSISYSEINSRLTNYDNKLKLQLETLTKLVELFAKRVKTLGVGNSQFFPQLKESMEKTEVSVSNLRMHLNSEYEENTVLERRLTHEVNIFEEALLQLEKPLGLPLVAPSTSKSRSTATQSTLAPAVCAFNDFVLTSGGHTDGWDPEMHLRFVTLFNSTVPKNAAIVTVDQVVAIHKHFPTMQPDKVETHCKWYVEYQRLLQAKKAAIRNWRVSHDLAVKHQQLVLEIEQESRSEADQQSRKTAEQEALARLEAKVQLSLWKEEKSRLRAEATEKEIRAKTESQALQQLEFKRKQEALKKKVVQYKLQKTEKQCLSTSDADHKHKGTIDESKLEAIRARNEELEAKKNKQRLQAMAKKEFQRQGLISQLPATKIQVASNPDRLLQPTKAMLSKIIKSKETIENENQEKAKSQFSVLKLYHR